MPRLVFVLAIVIITSSLVYALKYAGLSDQQHTYGVLAGMGILLAIKLAELLGKKRSEGHR